MVSHPVESVAVHGREDTDDVAYQALLKHHLLVGPEFYVPFSACIVGKLAVSMPMMMNSSEPTAGVASGMLLADISPDNSVPTVTDSSELAAGVVIGMLLADISPGDSATIS